MTCGVISQLKNVLLFVFAQNQWLGQFLQLYYKEFYRVAFNKRPASFLRNVEMPQNDSSQYCNSAFKIVLVHRSCQFHPHVAYTTMNCLFITS